MTKTIGNKRVQYAFATYYKFTPITNPEQLKAELQRLGDDLNLIGIILLAGEGINSTIAGSRENIDSFIAALRSRDGFHDLEVKYSSANLNRKPFRKLKIRIKKEIVTMGVEGIDAAANSGTYVEAEQWDELISDPEVLVIDTRNAYEYRLGSFDRAVDPRTLNFRQFPEAAKNMIEETKPKKVAMFCTGGIRCEKATAYVKNLGIENVYHLHGGILKYLETIPKEKSSWNGRCFVFDGRITVNHNLTAEPEPLCPRCGQVMIQNPQDKNYECVHCEEFPMDR